MSIFIVTGATGYIGSQLVKALCARGHKVRAIVRSTSDAQPLIDLGSSVSIYRYGKNETVLAHALEGDISVVFHLATCYIPRHKSSDIAQLIDSNIAFGTHLLEAVSRSTCKTFINASTATQYVTQSYSPLSLYAATKQAFEDILTYYTQRYSIGAISLRLPDTYGPSDSRNKVLNLVATAIAEDMNLDMSPGEQEIDLVHIDDVLSGLLRCVEIGCDQGVHQTYSLTSGNPRPLKVVVEQLNSICESPIAINFGAVPYRTGEIMNVRIPTDVLPGWSPSVSLEKGLPDLLIS